MGKWKQAFLNSLDPEYENPKEFKLGPPATEKQLAALEGKIAAKIPPELRELLQEFNGVTRIVGPMGKEERYFSTETMPEAGEHYRNWDWDTTLVMQLFAKVLFVAQENGLASMWGVVVKPFAIYKYGDVVSFDHDRISSTESETDLFTVNYDSLFDFVEARSKNSD